jgi:two-component system OmpR family sensor kinase
VLERIPIRRRIIIFQVVTLLLIAGLLVIGMFATFGIAAQNYVEEAARARANEAARIVEHTGTLTDADLATLNRDSVMIIAIDANGTIVRQIGSGLAEGTMLDRSVWGESAETGKATNRGARTTFERWDDSQNYLHIEPVQAEGSPIRFVVAGVNYDHVGETQYMWVTFAFVGFGVLAFVLITIGSIALVRYSLAPVTAIAESAAAISAADLSRRLPVRSGRDELGHLATTFNRLLDRLEAAFRERDDALAYQRRFVADASHELRTPLTSILGYTRLLRRWGLTHPEASAEAVARLEAEAIRMQSLVEGLLQLARGDEAGELPTEQVDLGELALAVVADASTASEQRIALELPEQRVVVSANAGGIRQVLGILLDNARKYAPGGETQVSVRAEDGNAVVVVRDTGPGIDPGQQERIFERFYRVEHARSAGGAGLGLAIAKDIVERHGGTIEVSSEPGAGTTFTVRLPMSTAAPSDGRAAGITAASRPT